MYIVVKEMRVPESENIQTPVRKLISYKSNNRVSSQYTRHKAYTGQFRSTEFQSYLNVIMFWCLFVKCKGLKLFSNLVTFYKNFS